MLLEECFDFLNPDDIRIKSHRIGIDNVIDYLIWHSRSRDVALC